MHRRVHTPRGRDILAPCGRVKNTAELSARERMASRAMAMMD